MITASWTAFGRESDSMTEVQAAALASGVGRAARAVAACRSPAEVASRSSSAAISGSSARPVAASRCSSAQRSSVSTASPSTVRVPSSSPASSASCSSVRAVAAKARAQASWWSLPGSAARSCSRHASVQRARPSSRHAGAAYRSSASFTWRCSDCTMPMSDSLVMPESTSSR